MADISAFFGKLTGLLEKELIPKFSDAAAELFMGLGDEPPSKESIVILLEEAFKKVLGSPNKSKKSPEPKKKVTKKKAKAAPKQKWVTRDEMEILLGEGEKCFCGFVAVRGPNKGKFCACEITDEAQNCGVMSAERVWVPHTIEDERRLVGEPYHNVRCRKCWAVGKDGAYRKEGAYDRMYNNNVIEDVDIDVEVKIPDIPELPETDPDDIDPSEKLVEGAERSITVDAMKYYTANGLDYRESNVPKTDAIVKDGRSNEDSSPKTKSKDPKRKRIERLDSPPDSPRYERLLKWTALQTCD